MTMKYAKYHALGNDYVVMSREELGVATDIATIQRICHRNYGIGSDGLLVYEGKTAAAFNVRIFNPDGSEAENSGNGMRIFSRYLFDTRQVEEEKEFGIIVGGKRKLTATILSGGAEVSVAMGQASFLSSEIPVTGPERQVINETIELLGETLTYSAVSVGNPHCVVFGRKELKEDALKFGPLLECDERFPRKTNVQFASCIDRGNLELQIWERNAGYTLASGSSASAVACVARRLGLCDQKMTMHMQGGKLAMDVDKDFFVKIRGAVTKVSDGGISQEMFAWV